MRIGILAKGGTDWIGGAHYTANLIRAVLQLPGDTRPNVHLVLPQGDAAELFADLQDTVPRHTREPNTPHSLAHFARWIEQLGIDCIYPAMRSLGAAFPVPWLAWIPDLQHRSMPERFSAEELRQRDAVNGRLADDAPGIVFSSRTTADNFTTLFPSAAHRTRVLHFHTVIDPAWLTPDPRKVMQRYNLPERYIALPNQWWAHKNHRTAFEAIRILRDRGQRCSLVCTGRDHDPRDPKYAPRLHAFVEQNNLGEQIRCLGLIPRIHHIQILRSAGAVLQPSRFEGWSTVVEDARAFGKPVLLSDIPVHREQFPPGARYFNPLDAEALADAIAEHWPTWQQSEPLTAESEAVRAQHRRVLEFARRFVTLLSEATTLAESGAAG